MLQVSKVREFISDMFQNFVQAGRAQHFATQVLITHTVTGFATNVASQAGTLEHFALKWHVIIPSYGNVSKLDYQK